MRGFNLWGIGLAVALGVMASVFSPRWVSAQPEPKLLPPSIVAAPTVMESPAQLEDPELQPAQFTIPSGVPSSAGVFSRMISDPPPPVVRIQVRVPADAPPTEDIKYVITVQNSSPAEAHSVTVRNPIPDSVELVVKAEPEWDKAKSTAKELVWTFGTLESGKSKSIQLTLRPKKDATEVKNLAYVHFEHGEAVTTKINKPAVKVTKFAPKQTVRDEPFTVRLAVDNTGKVPATKVRVVENIPASAEFVAMTKGAKRTDSRDAPAGTVAPNGQQWVWEIEKLMPGERRVIEYRLTARETKDVFVLTNLAGEKGATDKTEARTLVLVPGIAVVLTGPPGNAPVNPGETAKYEVTVKNTGTLASTNARVTATIPTGCRVTMKTEGGQLYRDAIQWVVPRLEGGEARTFRFGVKAPTGGRRIVVASVSDARGQRAAEELATVFQGTASLVWESVPNPVSLAVGKQGIFTVKVRNAGGEAAKNVRVEIDLPDAVNLVQASPNVRPVGNKLAFNPEIVPAYGEMSYTITYEARQAAQAWFKLKMTADCLGDRPMETQKAVEINGGSR